VRHPRFRADYQPMCLDDADQAYLVVLGEHRHLLIDDAASTDLVPLLDGTRHVGQLAELLSDRHSMAAVASAVRRLDGLGLLAEGPVVAAPVVAAGWDAREIDPDRAEEWTEHGRVLLVDGGGPAADLIAEVLARWSGRVDRMGVEDSGLPGVLADASDAVVVVAPDTFTDAALARVNDACLAAGRPWTLVRAHGAVQVLGPHLVPGVTGCWECLRQRWRDNEQVETYVASQVGSGRRPVAARGLLRPAAMAAAGLLAAELPVLALSGRSSRLTGRMITVDSRDLSMTGHELIRQPQCPACGDADLIRKADPRVELVAGAIRPTVEGGSRVDDTTTTLDRLTRHVSRYIGVVTRLDAMADDNGLAYSYVSGHNFAVASHPLALRKTIRGLSGGKGRTEAQAKLSAVAEAIERYCGVWRSDRPVHQASYAMLGADRAVHPRDLLMFSDLQYAQRDAMNAQGGQFHWIPQPLPDDQVIDWTTGWSLTNDLPRELPAAYCWYGHPESAALRYCAPDSNGCAAGATTTEAILQGFCELVERDSVALWWYHRSRMPGVDLDAFGDGWIDSLRAYYTGTLQRELWVLDLTADLGIPTFAAVSRHTTRPTEDVIVGFGAHLDAGVALSRSLAELNQFLPTVAQATGDRTAYGVTDPQTLGWYTTVRVADEPWLAPDPDQARTTPDTHASSSTGDIAEDVRRGVDLAARAGIEVIVVQQSRPELELAVVKVLAPGLRHFWRRLGPGRLWDVPPALARHRYAADESAINPYSVFF
jgi:oxazoline/thiazoline synthase